MLTVPGQRRPSDARSSYRQLPEVYLSEGN